MNFTYSSQYSCLSRWIDFNCQVNVSKQWGGLGLFSSRTIYRTKELPAISYSKYTQLSGKYTKDCNFGTISIVPAPKSTESLEVTQNAHQGKLWKTVEDPKLTLFSKGIPLRILATDQESHVHTLFSPCSINCFSSQKQLWLHHTIPITKCG